MFNYLMKTPPKHDKQKLDSLLLVSLEGVMGCTFGLITGRCLKLVTEKAIWYLGLGLCVMSGLHWIYMLKL